MAWRLATSPTSTSPVLENPTTEGVVRPPSALGMTVGSPASSTETTELVVPRSIPTALGMGSSSRTVSTENQRSVLLLGTTYRSKVECVCIKSVGRQDIPFYGAGRR